VLNGKVNFQFFISEIIHKHDILRFWVKKWCLSHLYNYSWPNMDGYLV